MCARLFKNPFFLAILSGVLCILAFPPFNFSFIIWFALIPLIYALVITPFEKKKFFAFTYYDFQLIGFLFGVIFYFGSLYWISNIFGLFGFGLLLILCIYPYFFAFALNYTYNKFNKKWLALFLPLIFWTAIEYIKSEAWWLKFTWMNLGYTQHNALHILQFANIFGQYGITALIILINSIFVYALLNKKNSKVVIKSISFVIMIGLVITSYGFAQLDNKYSPDISVALIQDESSEFSKYSELISKIDKNVDFILLPEYALFEYLLENPNLLDQIKTITQEHDSYFILGSMDKSKDLEGYFNTAFLFNPAGDVAGKYYKMNPIQFFNDGFPGKEYSVFDTEFGKVGIFICYDMDYSYVARNIVKNGAQLLFIPTYDAMGWSDLQHKQHSAMTSMRAVENGRFVARTATSGISQIIDPNGRIVYKIGIGKSKFIVGSVQKLSNQTIYTKIGFLFPFICIIVSIIIILLSLNKQDFR